MSEDLNELQRELERIKSEQRRMKKHINRLIHRRIDYLMKREVASIAKWATLLTKRVMKIEKDLKKIKKNFY